jgi:hypothetical protein
MRNSISIAAIILMAIQSDAQTEPKAGNWKTWFIQSGKEYRLIAPLSFKDEITEVITKQKALDSAGLQQIMYWNAGAPGYRWQEMMSKLWMYDTSRYGALANMLLNVTIYDAIITAWDSKYTYNRPRPYIADKRIKAYLPKPDYPSYPCEYSVSAGVAVTIFSHFYPRLADSVNRMAQRLMNARVASGLVFPSDTKAGFELGKKIAEKEIEYTKDFVYKAPWDEKKPQGPSYWKGQFAMFPLAGRNKTVVLTSGSQFRPGPPPDFAKEMEELKKYKSNFVSLSNAFYWANQDYWGDVLHQKMFEHNLHLNPPKASRLYAIAAIGLYDGFVSCWDAKYTYWGIRPDQYDTTYRPAILHTPPFPGYPSGHAAIGGVMSELYSYFFPADKALFRRKAKEGAESRFQAGIHFRTDNEVGLEMGKKIAMEIIKKVSE